MKVTFSTLQFKKLASKLLVFIFLILVSTDVFVDCFEIIVGDLSHIISIQIHLPSDFSPYHENIPISHYSPFTYTEEEREEFDSDWFIGNFNHLRFYLKIIHSIYRSNQLYHFSKYKCAYSEYSLPPPF